MSKLFQLLIERIQFCGMKNIGLHYENWKTGIQGPVLLTGLDQGKKDLTFQKWSYQVTTKAFTYSVLALSYFFMKISRSQSHGMFSFKTGWPKRRVIKLGLSKWSHIH